MTQTSSEVDVWLGKMQNELGVLSSNVMLLEIQKERLANKIIEDAHLIEALKERIKVAEEANTELKAALQPEREERFKVKNTRIGNNGSDPV